MTWLTKGQSPPVTRDPFLVQLFFAAHLDHETILEHIAHQRAVHEAKLQQYQQIEIPQLGDPELDRTRLFWRLTLEMGIATEQNYLDWLAQCEAIVRALDASSATTSSQEN
jgi:PadR family transcriptional regulator, regulatory protein AphA